jgi:hypothetical protein
MIEFMRKHVGSEKATALEELENVSDIPLSDELWNALAGLSILQLMLVRKFLMASVKKTKEPND